MRSSMPVSPRLTLGDGRSVGEAGREVGILRSPPELTTVCVMLSAGAVLAEGLGSGS